MEWYNGLFLSEGLQGKKDKLIEKIEKRAGTPRVYLITLAANKRDYFDIFSSNLMFQPVLHGHCPMIGGLAGSWDEAVDISADIALKSYETFGRFDIEAYLKSLLDDGEAYSFRYPSERLKKKKRLFF